MFWARILALAGIALAAIGVASEVHAEEGGKVAWLGGALQWKSGLKSGPNGPIPHIVVDQFGYRIKAPKSAVVRDPRVGYDKDARYSVSERYALVDVTTKLIIKEMKPVAWRDGAVDQISGDVTWRVDFSEIERAGRYAVVDMEKPVRSAEFSIGDSPYRDAMAAAVRMFYFQRAGMAKVAALAGPWADGASHLGQGQDTQSRPWPGTMAVARERGGSGVRSLQGGWYDAGDYNKYTAWTARAVIVLLQAYEEHPLIFGDNLHIPESGNGVPDILDEVKWGLDWLMPMQNEDGSVLCVQALSRATPPSAARGPSYYGPPTTSATLITSAAFAHAAKIFAARTEPELRAFAEDLARRARLGWSWAERNPSALFYNNDEARQPGSQGFAAGQQEMDEGERAIARFEAALRLHALDGAATYLDHLNENYSAIEPRSGPSIWNVPAYELLLQYARLRAVPPAVGEQIIARFRSAMARQLEQIESSRDPYQSPIREYTWGSNKSKLNQARLLQLLARVAGDGGQARSAARAAHGYVSYIHGLNPLGMAYLSNMGGAGASHSVSTIFHYWFATGTRWERVEVGKAPGPAPGYLVGGPNPAYEPDQCCNGRSANTGNRCGAPSRNDACREVWPPMGQPALKSYRDFSSDWPANSWQVSEPSLSYQIAYVLALAGVME